MVDSLFSLRFLLFVIGALFVLGIYFWGRANSKRNTRIKYEPRRARFEPAKRRGSSGQAKTVDREPPVDSDDAPPLVDNVESIGESVLVDEPLISDLPSITREGEPELTPPEKAKPAKASDPQLELTFDESLDAGGGDAQEVRIP